MMLFHPNIQRHIVILGPPTQRMQQQNWSFVSSGQQFLPGVTHQHRVSVVDRVAELKNVELLTNTVIAPK